MRWIEGENGEGRIEYLNILKGDNMPMTYEELETLTLVLLENARNNLLETAGLTKCLKDEEIKKLHKSKDYREHLGSLRHVLKML